MKAYSKFTTGLAALALASSSLIAQATTFHLPGDTVDFYYNDEQSDMAAYGELNAVGDSISATPTAFVAHATGNTGLDNFSATGSVVIVARPGYAFKTIGVQQLGDYELSGPGSSVSVTGILKVSAANNPGISQRLLMSTSGLGIADGSLKEWSSTGIFEMDTPLWSNVNSIRLSLSSMLSAQTNSAGGVATIQNKLVGGGLVSVETVVVPVPAAAWLFISGFIALLGFARSNQQLGK